MVCTLQPAKALLILDPRLPPIPTPTAATFQKLRVDQPQNRIVFTIECQNRMQIRAATAFRTNNRRVWIAIR